MVKQKSEVNFLKQSILKYIYLLTHLLQIYIIKHNNFKKKILKYFKRLRDKK